MVLSPLYERIFLNNLTTPPQNKYKDVQRRLKNSILVKSDRIATINLGVNLFELLENKKQSLPLETQKQIFYLNLSKSQYLIDFYLSKLKEHKDIGPFLTKVNKNLVPTYFDIIKLPVDISKITKEFSVNFLNKGNLRANSKNTEVEHHAESFDELFNGENTLESISRWLNQIKFCNDSLKSTSLRFDPWMDLLTPKWNLCITGFKTLLNQMCENYLTFNPPASEIKLMGDSVINYIYSLFEDFEINIFQDVTSMSDKGIKRLKLETNLFSKKIEYFDSSIFRSLYNPPNNHNIDAYVSSRKNSDISSSYCAQFKPQVTKYGNPRSEKYLRFRILESIIINRFLKEGFEVISLHALNMIIEVLDYLILKKVEVSVL